MMSKTSIGDDGVSVKWETSDKVYLWALNSGGQFALSGQEFTVYGLKDSKAFFTGTLSQAMEEGQYEYYCCYPAPVSSKGTGAVFEIPSTQDGCGRGIMIAPKASAGALRPLEEYVETQGLSMSMSQMLHLLQLSVSDPNNILQNERITKVCLTFPGSVVGTCSANLSNSSSALKILQGSDMLTVALSEPAPVQSTFYACILPTQWTLSDAIGVKIYSETKVAEGRDILLKARNMQKGHATPVRLTPLSIKNFCHFHIDLSSNPIGEDVTKITLTAPQGCQWGDKGSNIYVMENAAGIPVGTAVDVNYEEESLFRNLSGKTVAVSYESDHVIMSQNITIPNLSGIYACDLHLNVPEILNENFDKVTTFSSNDEYKTSKAGSYSAHAFLNGWSGGRIGAQAGKCIRIACRRETSSDYDARVDSAPLNCSFKKATDLKVSFCYGSNNQYGGIAIVTDGNVGQNCYVGYITTSKNYESGDSDGIFDRKNNTFYTKEYSGSYDNTPNDTDYIIKGIPAGTSPVRITWHTEIEHQAGTTNTTAWLYLDNIKVTIAK